jgi:hypothetical protein
MKKKLLVGIGFVFLVIQMKLITIVDDKEMKTKSAKKKFN